MIILRHNSTDFFAEAKKIELSSPYGEWRHFKFASTDEVLGIYETEFEGVEIHPDFFKYFLGQFSPTIESKFDIMKANDFKSFCEKLNDLLLKGKQILDLSVDSLWIWTVDEKSLELSPKLKSYLSY